MLVSTCSLPSASSASARTLFILQRRPRLVDFAPELPRNYQEEEEEPRGQVPERLLATDSGWPLASVVVAPHGAHDVVSSGVLVCLGLCGGHCHGRLRIDVRTHARLHRSLMPRCGARPPACGLRLRRSVRVCGVVACSGGGSDWRCRKRQVGGLASASSARRASGRC